MIRMFSRNTSSGAASCLDRACASDCSGTNTSSACCVSTLALSVELTLCPRSLSSFRSELLLLYLFTGDLAELFAA
jgi:hypothetical protein